jgi:PTS system galactitol-specific IIA component
MEISEIKHPAINKDLIVLNMTCTTAEEVIQQLAEILTRKKYVKDEYIQMVLNREREYPTGLPTSGTAVAIPHTNAEYCLESAMVTGILREPVPFGNMANPDEKLPVRIVFLLAMKEPAFQVTWLRKLVAMLQKEGMLENLINCTSASAVASLLNKAL